MRHENGKRGLESELPVETIWSGPALLTPTLVQFARRRGETCVRVFRYQCEH